jgi:dephospho-CoA kinase
MVIGLTGRSGCGKSVASKFLLKQGFVIIDFDKISRTIYKSNSECFKELIEYFGRDITDEYDNLKRKELAEIVFNNSEALKKLNTITHKYIYEEAKKIKESNKDKNIVYDAPLLFEANLDIECDYIISILSDDRIQIERIIKRDHITEELAKKRLASQKPNNFFIEHSDFYIMNNSTIEKFEEKLKEIIDILNKK